MQERRIALLLEYDGGRFAGSQLQANAVTVQSVLEDAIERTTEVRTRVAFAGRTDAGVHARGQVASFVTTSTLPVETMQRALNAWLPEDVVVKSAADVESAFDPRRQALRRHYRYIIDNGRTRNALDRARAWHVGERLDTDAMRSAATALVGVHDFRAFASALENPEASTVREIFCIDLCRQDDHILFDVWGSAFLPHQVRRMVGALVEVGRGKRSADEFARLLDGPTASAGPVAPAHALYLMEVDYGRPVFGASVGTN